MKTNEIYSQRSKKRKTLNKLKTAETAPEQSCKFSDELRQRFFVNPPFFNFLYAEDELGLNFNELCEEGFANFLENIYHHDLIELRKSYIKRDYAVIRFISHKFKSPFT